MNDPFARLGYAMVRFRWIVLLGWLVALGVVGGVLAPQASSVVRGGGFIVDDSDSARAATVLEQEFNASTRSNVVVVFHSETQTALEQPYRGEVEGAVARIAALEDVNSVFTLFNTGQEAFISEDGRTTFALVSLAGDEAHVQEMVGELREQMHDMTIEHYVTGLPAINYDTEITSENDLRRAEVFTIPIVLLLLLIVFRTVISAAIPLILGVVAVVMTIGVIYLIGQVTDTSIFALNVASMLGLGLGIDFSLLVINRFREERELGYPTPEAVARTLATAGRSITYSGITVVLAMGVLTVMLYDMMLVRSISLAVMLVAMMALIGGLTLLPAVLGILQHRLEWLPVLPRRKKRAGEHEGMWYRWSHAIMRRPGTWLMVSLVVLIFLGLPMKDIAMVGATTGVLPPGDESVQGANRMDEAFGANRLTPIQIVVEANEPGGVWDPTFLSGVSKLTQEAFRDRRVEEVQSLRSLLLNVPEEQFVALTPDYFTPAPDMQDWTDLSEINIEGVEIETIIYARVPDVPPAPAFVGVGRFTLEPGTTIPQTTAPAFQVLRLLNGSLTVEAGGPTTVTTADAPLDELAAPVGSAFTVNTGDQIVIPSNTPIAIQSNPNEPTVFMSVSIFVIRSSTEPQTTWTEGSPAPDLFAGIPREVLAGGVATMLPDGESVIQIDRATAQPGAFFPKHTHPGPELIAVEEGTFTIFAAPPNEMTMTGADGRVEEGPFDTPIPLTAGAKALVQGGGIHRGRNLGDVQTVFYSTRVYDANELPFNLIGPTQLASQFVNLTTNGDAAVISIIANEDQYSSEHQNLVYDLRNTIIPDIPELDGYTVYVGGDAAGFIDFRDTLYGRFPYIVLAVTLLVFTILMMFFQSVFLPLKAILMNFISLLATFGVLIFIFQYGYFTDYLGFESQGLLNVITPAILFVIVFALSTDYEVFMLSRVKEYYHELGDNDEAVAAGLQHTAGVITAAGLILIGTFGSFASAQVVTIKEIGLGLAIGVLIDATIVRIIMVPSTMKLMGDTNWWMPQWLRRIVPELREGPAPEMSPQPALASVAAAIAPQPPLAFSGSVGGEAPPAWQGDVPVGPGRADYPPRQPATQMIGQLRSIGGWVGAEVIPLPRTSPFIIGRDKSASLQLFDARVSREHALIKFSNGQYDISDLRSTNGVYINGTRIAEPTVLRNEDRIEIGNAGTMIFRFEMVPMTDDPG
jgi:uncharacterized membrane protein YdfJ with MMPL/SSD domain/quercetin dioxygenase-like cupin family protein